MIANRCVMGLGDIQTLLIDNCAHHRRNVILNFVLVTQSNPWSFTKAVEEMTQRSSSTVLHTT